MGNAARTTAGEVVAGVAAGRGRMTLAEYARTWLGRQERLAPNSLRAYRSVLANHVLPALGALCLDALTTPVIRCFLQDQLAAGKPRRSVQSYHAALCTVLTDAL